MTQELFQERNTQTRAKGGISLGNIVLLAGVMMVIIAVGVALVRNSETLGEGDNAPRFALTTFNGDDFRLADYRGQIVVLNFWASWCGPCHHEAPDLQRIHELYHDEGVVLIGITYTEASQQDSIDFIEQYQLTYANGPDIGAVIAEDYQITGVPETFVIDRDGTLAKYYPGTVNEATLSDLLDDMLAEAS
jgi:cytochrome c biogenesis protein CcmG/thiol:disulfide interchange protein DsbE